MSFSKAKLKRFNDVDVDCANSPATARLPTDACTINTPGKCIAAAATPATTTAPTTTSGHPERKEQIEKFFKDAVRFATSSKEAKEFAIPKDAALKDDKKSKGLRLFRTPSLPQRLRFRHNASESATAAAAAAAVAAANNNNGSGASTASSTPMHSATNTPVKDATKSGSRLKGKEALQHEIRKKNELLESYMSQIDVLKRHVEQLKETERKLREENASVTEKTENLIHALQAENATHKELNDRLSAENVELAETCNKRELEIKALVTRHANELEELQAIMAELRLEKATLEQQAQEHGSEAQRRLQQLQVLQREINEARERLVASEQRAEKDTELIQNLRNTNESLSLDLSELRKQVEHDALSYAQETKITQNEMECLKKERSTLKNDLASKCELIKSLQDELLDKTCEIDAHCDTIRQLCREKSKLLEKEQLIEKAEEKLRSAEEQAEQKVQKLESDLENALEREKAYWRAELDRRQKLAENEIIKVELEKQDVMVLLETTNDMLRDRDEKIHKYEEQLRNGIDYYIQLNDTLQKQIVDLKQEIAKIITEKYNYQLTLSNTRSTVNILMERLKKSDADVEQFKAELESVQLAKGALEQSYLTLQSELEALRSDHAETETALKTLCQSSQTLQQEERINTTDVAHYLEMYNELKRKDETREQYMQDMKKALDEFATVLQFAQLELDSKEKSLHKVRDECEQLKLENMALKSKVDEGNTKKENSTDLEKIEDLLIDTELRAECDKIASWLLSSSASEKCVRTESTNEINELLKPTTPNSNSKKNRSCLTPSSPTPANKTITLSTNAPGSNVGTPRTPRTPKTPRTPRTTPKKTVLFPGKENICSPQKQVLKARNM
ncbi:PREDICTED: probable DNA double-strand break repair Rad50 ATPase isoform X2 [Rhagoletis zephyria]|uniref:probable DNA double-strand break repair Rad50 ATPase isoform X2 n=1 Tax=Rhagoletis zephyria TaxID=28612 RepID=UPI0008112EFB|nr:PREDICTED: probable DNA double-strand break repair Rad50 ATPase isoform X2 [Rhagoletis zephyria]